MRSQQFKSGVVFVIALIPLAMPMHYGPRAGSQVKNAPGNCAVPPPGVAADVKIAYLQCRLAQDEQRITNLENSVSGDDTGEKVSALTKQVNNLQTAVNDLQAQVANLRMNPSKESGSGAGSNAGRKPSNNPSRMPNLVTAPFTVVSRAGKTLFTVDEDEGAAKVSAFDGAGQVYGGMAVSNGNPLIAVRGNGQVVAAIRAIDGVGAFQVRQNGKNLASLDGFQDHGELVIFDSGGNVLSAVTGDSDGGLVSVSNHSGVEKAHMKIAADGTGGHLCTDRKGNVWCVGINLPLTLTGK
jgi:hypothetical protein